jgi:glycosyltransferase involved in cell wall biosynthesis
MNAQHIVMDVRRLRDFGIGTYIRNLVRALAELDHDNRYTLITQPGQAGELCNPGPNFQCADYRRSDTAAAHDVTFPLLLRRFKADLFHIPLNSVAYWMPRPYVLTIHDMSTLLFPAQGDVRSALHNERYRRGAARAARIIAVSHSTRRDIEAVLGVPPENVRTIYSAPDPAFASGPPDAAEDRKILERYSIHPPFLLYAGSVRPQKNVPRLVEAFALLRTELENHPDYGELRLVIIGDELSRSPAVRRAVVATRMERFVRPLGFVPTETLKAFYRAASLFAFPSLYEGFGLAPLEAMLCGTPVVASNLPALVEAVGSAAELVTPDNVFDIARGLRAVLLDPARRKTLVEAGLTQARRFQWEYTARAVLDIYRGINE